MFIVGGKGERSKGKKVYADARGKSVEGTPMGKFDDFIYPPSTLPLD